MEDSENTRSADDLDGLLAEIDRLRGEVEALRDRPAAPRTESRRSALRLAGAAVGAVGGGLALAQPAAAADPNDVVKNVANGVTATTSLTGNIGSTVLSITNSGTAGRAIQGTSGAVDISTIRGDNTAMVTHTFDLVANSYQTGEFHQAFGTLFCMVNSTTRRSIAAPNSAGAFYPIDPVRAYDSRVAIPAPGTLATGANRVVSVADGRSTLDGSVTLANAVPFGATAVVFNIAVGNTVGTGFLAITQGAAVGFNAAIITWSAAGVVLSNASTVAVDASRQVKVVCGGTGSTNFVIDVMGYYT